MPPIHRLRAWWSSLMRNPLRRRLIHRSGCLASSPAILGAVVFALLAWHTVVVGFEHSAFILSPFIVIALSFSLVLTLPVFLAAVAVNLPAGYIRSGEYELVCAAPLNDGELVWGYVSAALYRIRMPLTAALLLTPLLMLFFPVPWPYRNPFASPLDTLSQWQPVLFALIGVVAMLGRVLCVAALGVTLYLWWRLNAPAMLAALFVAEVLWWAGAFAFTELTRSLGWQNALAWQLSWTLLLSAVPFGVAFAALRAGRHWARRNMTLAEKPW